MTLDEYNLKQKALKEEYEKNERALMRQYALESNNVKIGDIVMDHMGTVLVEKVQISLFNDPPCCVYFGTMLAKDGTPYKRKANKRQVFQPNLTNHDQPIQKTQD